MAALLGVALAFGVLWVLWMLASQLWHWRQGYFGFAFAPGWLPFVGHGVSYGMNPEAFMRSHMSPDGEPVALQVFSLKFLLITKPKDFERWSRLSHDAGSFVAAGESFGFATAFPPVTVTEEAPHTAVVRGRFTLARFSFVPRLNRSTERVAAEMLGAGGTTLDNVFPFCQRLVATAALATMVGEELATSRELYAVVCVCVCVGSSSLCYFCTATTRRWP